MSRIPREYSESGYMHVMARGLTRQIIFENDDDMVYFLNKMSKYSNEFEIKIICYCLMINHVHILIFDKNKNVSHFMKNLCGCYSMYFNKKYDRCGILFQRPFKSKVVNDDSYLLSVYRYIINNPVHEGIASAQNYKWSSYKYYGKNNKIVDDSIIMNMIGANTALDQFLAAEKFDDSSFIKFQNKQHLTDNEASKKILNKFHMLTTTNISIFSKDKRNEAIRWLRDEGLSIRQIERLTGVSRGIIQNIY